MDYEKTYNKLIDAARTQQIDGYYETHHIVPKAEGGSDDTTNLVKLTARQHYIAHLLLAKIYDDCAMHCAIVAMQAKTKSMDRNFRFNSRLYEKLKLKRAKFMSERMKGHPVSEETRKKCSATGRANKGRVAWNRGKKTDDATKKKISESTKLAMQRDDVREKYLAGYRKRKLPPNIGKAQLGKHWWTDGKNNIISKEPPGSEWRRGRLKKKSSEN